VFQLLAFNNKNWYQQILYFYYNMHINRRKGWIRGAVTLEIRIREVVSSNFGEETGSPEIFRGLSQSLQENDGTLPRFGQEHFLPDRIQFIFHQSFYHPTLCSPDTDTVVM
jgi:hypothetical protein